MDPSVIKPPLLVWGPLGSLQEKQYDDLLKRMRFFIACLVNFLGICATEERFHFVFIAILKNHQNYLLSLIIL